MFFEVTRLIARKPEQVWPILVDRRRLVEGGFGILRLDGEIVPGGRLKLWPESSPKRGFALRVSSLTPPNHMTWEGGMPFGLFRGVRRYSLNEAPGGCTFHMREDYSGPLAGLIARSIPDLTPFFEKFADALKRQAEGHA